MLQVVNARDAAFGVQKLGRRIHLKRPHSQFEFCVAAHAIAQLQHRRAADCRGHRHRCALRLPCHRRNREITVLERLRDFDIGPRQQLAADDQKRLDRIAALERLDVAVFADERFVLGTIGADPIHRQTTATRRLARTIVEGARAIVEARLASR